MSQRAPMNSETFVNRGLLHFEERRREWLQPNPAGPDASKPTSPRAERSEVKAKTVDVEEVINRVFSQTGNGRLQEAVPLGQMIDILIDFWEADGLYE